MGIGGNVPRWGETRADGEKKTARAEHEEAGLRWNAIAPPRMQMHVHAPTWKHNFKHTCIPPGIQPHCVFFFVWEAHLYQHWIHSPTKTGVFLEGKNVNRKKPLTLNGLFSIDQLEASVRGLLLFYSNTNSPQGYLNAYLFMPSIRRGDIK